MSNVLSWTILLVTIVCPIGLLLGRDRRWSLVLLAIQYLGVFGMVQTHWPITLAAAKLISGWMACAVLGISVFNTKSGDGNTRLWMNLFLIFISGIVILATFALAEQLNTWLGPNIFVTWGGLILLGLGLLHLGITSDPQRIIIGLLTVLAGFETLYSAVENSVLVSMLLVVITLGLALTSALTVSAPREITS